MKRAALFTPIAALAVALLIVSIVVAQSGGDDLAWNSIDGGGTMYLTGGGYSLSGTIGQPDAGALSGGDYTLNSGFWGGVDTVHRVYLPVVLR